MEEIEKPVECGLMYVEIWVNHKAAKNTIVDSKATHNFMTETEAKRLNILWHRDVGKMKAVNLAAVPVLGVAKRTPIKLGTWTGQTNFVIVKMDDFDIVLGMDFLLEHIVIPMRLAKKFSNNRVKPAIIQTNTHQPERVKKMSAL